MAERITGNETITGAWAGARKPGRPCYRCREMSATYDDIVSAPEHFCAEILAGELVLTRRGLFPQARVFSNLLRRLGDACDHPDSGWILVPRPEVHFRAEGLEVLVPAVAAWTRARLPEPPESWAQVPRPDWVCEISAPAANPGYVASKKRIFAREGVGHLWVLDMDQHALETYELVAGEWRSAVGSVPCEAAQIDVAKLWNW